VAIGNVGVAARIENEASTANLPKTFLSRYFYLCMSLVLAALVMSGFSRIVNANLFHANPPRPVAFVGTRSGLLNVDSLLYRSVGSGAHAEGQPLLGWFGAGLLTVMPWRFIGADRSWWRCLSSRQLKTLRLRYSPQHRVRKGAEMLFSARHVAVYRACLVEEATINRESL
jgi:hypothetical protein